MRPHSAPSCGNSSRQLDSSAETARAGTSNSTTSKAAGASNHRKIKSMVVISTAERNEQLRKRISNHGRQNDEANHQMICELAHEQQAIDDSSREKTGEENKAAMLSEIAMAINQSVKSVDGYIAKLESTVAAISDPDKKCEEYNKLGANPLVLMHYNNVTHLANIASQLTVDALVPTYSQMVQVKPKPSVQSEARDASQADQPRVKRRREDTHPKMPKFKLVMSPKVDTYEDPMQIYRKFVDGSKIQLAGQRIKGREVRLLYYVREHAELALKKLTEARHGQKRVSELYNLFITVISEESLRTQKITRAERDGLPFVREGVFDHGLAREKLLEHNPMWFNSIQDIDCVEMHETTGREGGYIIEVYVSRRAQAKFINRSRHGKGTIDMGSLVLTAYITAKDDYCFRCLDHTHWWKECKASEPNCRFCEEHHMSMECPLKFRPNEHVCRNCSAANAMRDADKEVDDNHPATSTKCPWVRERMTRERKQLHAKRNNRKNVNTRK